MKAFEKHEGIAAPMDRANVDTDMIIPKQFLKSIHRTGFGPNLFDELRYLDVGQPGMDNSQRPLNKDFPLNQARDQGASILLARENFGCGSSREHAPWALLDFGIRCVISTSFADIFYNNCFKNGILPIKVSKEDLAKLMDDAERGANATLTVDLEAQEIRGPDGGVVKFDIDAFRKHCLIEGLDDIGLTMVKADKISSFEKKHAAERPWA
jgi:3-isopropylmalate/(R)-2-methylmalate dehydratase small subunit